MTMTRDQLASALVDVRKAYRLLHEYHRRLNDLLQKVEDTVGKKGLGFESWAPHNVARLPRGNRPFFAPGTWAWDLTPAYQVECAWASAPKKGKSIRIGLVAIADDGYGNTGEGEPQPAQFKDPAACSTELWLAGWTTAAKSPNWGSAWEKVQRIPKYDDHRRHTVKSDGDTYTYQYLKTVNVADIVDGAAVQEHILGPIERWLDKECAST